VLPEQTLAESLAANIDSAAPEGAVTPLDAALLLQQRVGIINRFPVQARASENHPGPGALPADKELAPRSGVVSLRWAGETCSFGSTAATAFWRWMHTCEA